MARHLAPGGWGILQLGTEEQAERVADRCAARGLGLEVRETRVYDRGVLVRLAATRLTQSRRTDLCVLSHHGIRWDR